MPFSLRATATPPLNRLLELEQIVIVDKTGPNIPLGPANGASCLVAEWLSGPFIPREVTSTADLIGCFGGVSNLLSQTAAGVQDGSGARYEGNGAIALLSKRFTRLVIQRVDTDMVADDTVASPVKVFVKFSVTINASDQDPLDATVTGKPIVVPAGQRFGDAALGSATYVVALSQKITIPKGSAITGGKIDIAYNLVQGGDGDMYLPLATDGLTANSGATAFFVKGTTNSGSALDTAIDTALPGVLSTIAATGIDAINAAGASSAAVAPGTAALTLSQKIESLYAAAIGKTRPTGAPQEDIVTIWSARRGTTATTIRNVLVNNAIDSSSEGRGRIAIVSGPRVGSVTGDGASVQDAKDRLLGQGAYAGIGTTDETPGSGVESADRRIITFPYVQVFSGDLSKNVVVGPDGIMAATLSQFPEEKNPGARNDFIQDIQSFESAYQTSPLGRQDYVNFKSRGISALRKDRAVGWWFQSGVTSVNPQVLQARAPIKRRRMADLIQDTLNSIGARYNKEPATTERVDQMIGEVDSFLGSLKSPPNPGNKRIEDYLIDEKSGNTAQLVALGLFTIIVKVRLLASLDTIVFETTIGETVEIPAAT